MRKRKSNFDPNALGMFSKILINVALSAFSIICIVPLILVVVVSLTSEKSLAEYGYQFFPKEFSLSAYYYVFKTGRQLLRSYGVSIFVTVAGTFIGIMVMTMYAYVISRKSFKYRNAFSFIAFFTLLFNGGMVSFYIVCSRYLGMKNSIWALILPYIVNAFYVLVLRSFFVTNLSDSILEAAKIDGAKEFTIFIKIVFPLSVPGIATIGLFLSLQYWNDWYLGMLFIDNSKLVPIQYMLMKIQQSMEFILSAAKNMGGNNRELIQSMPSESSRMALVIFAIGPIILAYPFFQKYFVKGLTLGGVKG